MQGLDFITSLTDIEVGVKRDTVFDTAAGRNTRRGYTVDVRLPVFDWGDARRMAMNANTLAAAYRLEAAVAGAASQLRESYSAYRTAYDLARHYRDEIVPLRKVISEENGLRYNGMIIGVFELLADTRDQVPFLRQAPVCLDEDIRIGHSRRLRLQRRLMAGKSGEDVLPAQVRRRLPAQGAECAIDTRCLVDQRPVASEGDYVVVGQAHRVIPERPLS